MIMGELLRLIIPRVLQYLLRSASGLLQKSRSAALSASMRKIVPATHLRDVLPAGLFNQASIVSHVRPGFYYEIQCVFIVARFGFFEFVAKQHHAPQVPAVGGHRFEQGKLLAFLPYGNKSEFPHRLYQQPSALVVQVDCTPQFEFHIP